MILFFKAQRLLLHKSYVRAHTRALSNGQVVQVVAYEDSRVAQPEISKNSAAWKTHLKQKELLSTLAADDVSYHRSNSKQSARFMRGDEVLHTVGPDVSRNARVKEEALAVLAQQASDDLHAEAAKLETARANKLQATARRREHQTRMDALLQARKDFQRVIDTAHHHRNLVFHPLPDDDFDSKSSLPIFQSKSYGKKPGSAYRLILVGDKPAYARASDHWGVFHTRDFDYDNMRPGDDPDEIGYWKRHDWNLEGSKPDGKRRAGYILLEDLMKKKSGAPAPGSDGGKPSASLSEMQERPGQSGEEPAQPVVGARSGEKVSPRKVVAKSFSPVFFLKAQRRGLSWVMGDLFETQVPVKAHTTKDGAFVPEHMTTVKKRRADVPKPATPAVDHHLAALLRMYAGDAEISHAEITEAVRQYRAVEAANADALRAHDEEGKPLPAPNGQPSNLNRSQWVLVRTPNFKNWFGDWENDPASASKAVDANGEPMVVYHGTGVDVDRMRKPDPFPPSVGTPIFWTPPWDDTKGPFYFTSWPESANGYADVSLKVHPDTAAPNVMQCFLSLRNPVKHDAQGRVWIYVNNAVLDQIEAQQADGSIIHNVVDHADPNERMTATVLMALHARQVKSATANVGTYRPDLDHLSKAHCVNSKAEPMVMVVFATNRTLS